MFVRFWLCFVQGLITEPHPQPYYHTFKIIVYAKPNKTDMLCYLVYESF